MSQKKLKNRLNLNTFCKSEFYWIGSEVQSLFDSTVLEVVCGLNKTYYTFFSKQLHLISLRQYEIVLP